MFHVCKLWLHLRICKQVVNLDTGIGSINLGNLVVGNLQDSGNIFDIHMYNNLDVAINQVKLGKGILHNV